jgi:MFS family permease
MDPADMGTPAPAPPLPLARLAGVGTVVFLANAALLVLQLVAGKLLNPFLGSSLETWTVVIGAFMTGIALGNGFGGKLADRFPRPSTLAALLVLGAATAAWMVVFPAVLAQSGVYKSIPLGPRIPLLTFALCLPAGVVLSLLTPVAIRLGLPDVSKTGRVTGLVFALSTLGCLLGNYVTGFYLIPEFYLNTLTWGAAGALVVLAVVTLVILRNNPSPGPSPKRGGENHSATELAPPPRFGEGDGGRGSEPANPHAFADIRRAFLVVFLASFGGMALELTASRVLATFLGVSIYTWTGVIGVMLAGTALGNLTGGLIADRVNRPGSPFNPRHTLAASLMAGGAATTFIFVAMAVVQQRAVFETLGPIGQVLGWTFSLFFLPMFALGTISPQVIRLAVPDVANAGRIAGRVYAWSTAGAIAGTFAAGYVLLSTVGTHRTMLGIAAVLALTSLLVAKVWTNNPMLYLFSIVLGGVTGGFILTARGPARGDPDLVALLETNYYTIKVSWDRTVKTDEHGHEVPDEQGRRLWVRTGNLNLTLDHLKHSTVNPDDPRFLYYEHEHIQVEFLRAARARAADPRVLVIGGGGYTFPRYAMEEVPGTRLDVVEIDPGVTRVAREHLGLKDYSGMNIEHLDGRQYVAERAPRHAYDLFVQDAVNDLSVPAHLLTKEYNDAVKAVLKPADGVYLLTVIDSLEHGRLWKSAMRTLGQTFDHVALLTPDPVPEDPPANASADDRGIALSRKRKWGSGRQVLVIYASDRPLDLARMQEAVGRQTGATGPVLRTHEIPAARLAPFLAADPGVILTDQYAPVDNLMAEVFRRRND